MRSVLIISGFALGVILLVLQGYVPRKAGAVTAAKDFPPERATDLEVKYADYATEQRLVGERGPSAARDSAAQAADPSPEPPRPNPQPEPRIEPPPPEPAKDADPAQSAPEPTPPVADAGSDRVVWVGAKEATLDASRSTGEGLTCSWRQAAGPHQLKITDPAALKTTVAGFANVAEPSWEVADYEFELTVTDANGQQAVAATHILVKTAPDLTVRPSPKRQVASRDGYQIAHLESWKTGRGTNAETFELRSPSELYIHHYAGDGAYDVAASESSSGRVYQITVYYQEGRPTTWVELFVDTAERVPAILQLGVNWE